MKRSRKSRKGPSKERSSQKIFTTIDEFTSHFFPKVRPEKEVTRGKDRGSKAAENAFTEITKTLQI